MPPIPIAWYFYRVRHDHFIFEFCVANARDPNQYVESDAPDGSKQKWRQYHEGDLLVFTAPDGYQGGPLGWFYDDRLQQGQAMPRSELERRALGNRVSVHFPKMGLA